MHAMRRDKTKQWPPPFTTQVCRLRPSWQGWSIGFRAVETNMTSLRFQEEVCKCGDDSGSSSMALGLARNQGVVPMQYMPAENREMANTVKRGKTKQIQQKAT